MEHFILKQAVKKERSVTGRSFLTAQRIVLKNCFLKYQGITVQAW